MTDDELLSGFRDASLPGDAFHHAEHVRVAFLSLSRDPLLSAAASFRDGLRRFAEAKGAPGRYHETITFAYLLLVHDRMGRHPERTTWEAFAAANPDLLTWKPSVLDALYLPETLASELARRAFLFPDAVSMR